MQQISALESVVRNLKATAKEMKSYRDSLKELSDMQGSGPKTEALEAQLAEQQQMELGGCLKLSTYFERDEIRGKQHETMQALTKVQAEVAETNRVTCVS